MRAQTGGRRCRHPPAGLWLKKASTKDPARRGWGGEGHEVEMSSTMWRQLAPSGGWCGAPRAGHATAQLEASILSARYAGDLAACWHADQPTAPDTSRLGTPPFLSGLPPPPSSPSRAHHPLLRPALPVQVGIKHLLPAVVRGPRLALDPRARDLRQGGRGAPERLSVPPQPLNRSGPWLARHPRAATCSRGADCTLPPRQTCVAALPSPCPCSSAWLRSAPRRLLDPPIHCTCQHHAMRSPAASPPGPAAPRAAWQPRRSRTARIRGCRWIMGRLDRIDQFHRRAGAAAGRPPSLAAAGQHSTAQHTHLAGASLEAARPGLGAQEAAVQGQHGHRQLQRCNGVG